MFCIKMNIFSQRKKILLFLPGNMAAVSGSPDLRVMQASLVSLNNTLVSLLGNSDKGSLVQTVHMACDSCE